MSLRVGSKRGPRNAMMRQGWVGAAHRRGYVLALTSDGEFACERSGAGPTCTDAGAGDAYEALDRNLADSAADRLREAS